MLGFMIFIVLVLAISLVFRYFTTQTWELIHILWYDIISLYGTRQTGYRQTFNIRSILVSIKLVDHSDVVGASPVGAAPTKSSFST